MDPRKRKAKSLYELVGSKEKKGKIQPPSDSKLIHPLTKRQNKTVTIYYDRVYRYVEDFSKLWGEKVHISTGPAASLLYKDPEEFKNVPFSHGEVGVGALFEMKEIEELTYEPKAHQPGTAVADELNDEMVQVKRIFYSLAIDPEFKAQIDNYVENQEEAGIKIEMIPFDFEAISTYKFVLRNSPRAYEEPNFGDVPLFSSSSHNKREIKPSHSVSPPVSNSESSSEKDVTQDEVILPRAKR